MVSVYKIKIARIKYILCLSVCLFVCYPTNLKMAKPFGLTFLDNSHVWVHIFGQLTCLGSHFSTTHMLGLTFLTTHMTKENFYGWLKKSGNNVKIFLFRKCVKFDLQRKMISWKSKS